MSFVRRLKTFALQLSLSPIKTLAEIGQRFGPIKKMPDLAPVKNATRRGPLILQIETTNLCNARCAFCAYPKMKRAKGVMSLSLFEKIIHDYANMGGGAISLTPIMGDPLLDPDLLQRIQLLNESPKISQIALTTNAIAMDRFSDEQLAYLSESLTVVQLSIGGLDAETYRAMYQVDCFAQVKEAMNRLLAINQSVQNPAHLAFGFRTNDWGFEHRFKRELKEFRRQGIAVSHIWTYANYGGLVKGDLDLGLEVYDSPYAKNRSCALPHVHLAVCWDGRVTACGCADAEGRGLYLGQAAQDSLADLWFGEKRANLLTAFEEGKPPKFCQACSAYQQDTILASLGLNENHPGAPLPRTFYDKFWGA